MGVCCSLMCSHVRFHKIVQIKLNRFRFLLYFFYVFMLCVTNYTFSYICMKYDTIGIYIHGISHGLIETYTQNILLFQSFIIPFEMLFYFYHDTSHDDHMNDTTQI